MAPKQALFLFRRDLRLPDNTTLIQAIKDGYRVLPVFIFSPEQIDPKKNPYFSHPAVQFMCESLEDLNQSLQALGSRLHFFKGENLAVLKKIYQATPFDAVYSNQDYSVYSTQRDQSLQEWCDKKGIPFLQKEDYGLLPLREGLVENERPYLILSQFYKKFQAQYQVRPVDRYKYSSESFATHSFPFEYTQSLHSLYVPPPSPAIHGGRTQGLLMLERIKTLKDYQDKRDYPALEKTSKASPHLKFGTVSIREMYERVRSLYGPSHGLIRELVFREFYMKIYALRPSLQRGKALYHKLDQAIPWSYHKKNFQAWKEGLTGFPLVDAGMRELNTTGHQHNRIRMLCGSVLTKYLLIDWRWGLQYYYTHLVDADIYSNTAGWGFVSSTGPDGVPYFRAPFNPFIQSKKFDKEAEYIKRWVPELAEVPPKDIHKWFDPTIREKYVTQTSYPAPIVDHKEASAHAIEVFKKAFAEKYAD